jgi:hypothetical protein
LFEQEIPEVFDGLIMVKNVVRIPGEKAKVAVDSYDDRIDPVGACVGMKGSRIRYRSRVGQRKYRCHQLHDQQPVVHHKGTESGKSVFD